MNRSLASSTKIKSLRKKKFPSVKSTQSEKSEHYGTKEKLEKKKLELREKRRVRSIIIGKVIRTVLYLLLAIGLLVLVILALYIVWEMGTTSSVLSKAWKFHPLPVTYPFGKFVVSSNSEMCNELARILHIEGHSFLGVATAVMICLHITEPNRRRFYDPGIAILADMNNKICQQTNGLPTLLDSSFTHGNTFLQDRTFQALYDRLDPTERSTLVEKFKRRFSNYPVSRTLASYIHQLGTALHFMHSYGEMFYDDSTGRVLQEGDIFLSRLPSIFEDFEYLDRNNTNSSRPFPSTAMLKESDHNLDNNADMDLWQSTEQSGWTDIEPISFVDNRSVCLPRESGNSSVMQAILRSFSDQVEGRRKVSYDAEVDPLSYAYAYLILRPLEHQMKIFGQRHHRRRHQQQEIPSTGNFFTILDRAEQRAIAFSGNGEITTEGSKKGADPFAEYSSPPLVVYDKDQIQVVWTGPRRLIDQTLEVPRLVHALLFQITTGKPLTEAVTTPLFFPFGNTVYYTEGLSWDGLNTLRELILSSAITKPLLMLSKSSKLFQMDAAAAIETRENGTFPLFFDRGGTSIIPNGI